MIDLVVPPQAVPGVTRVRKDLPDGRSVEGVVPKGARPGDHFHVPVWSAIVLRHGFLALSAGIQPREPAADDDNKFAPTEEAAPPGIPPVAGPEPAPEPAPAPTAEPGPLVAGRGVTVTVPEGARAGDQLSIPLPDGSEVTITLPQGARPGDDLEIPTGGARTAAPPKAPKRPGPIAAASNAPAQRVKQADCVTPGGTIMINVPPGARPGAR